MLGILLGVFTIGLGIKAFTPAGLPLTKSKNLTGAAGRLVGAICILLGIAFILDGCFGTARIIAMLSSPAQSAPPVVATASPIANPVSVESQPATPAEMWGRFHTVDGICSAEFPGTPKRAQTRVQVIELHQMILQRGSGKGTFALNLISAPSDVPSQSLDEAVASLRQQFGAVNDHAIKQGAVDGWQLDSEVGAKMTLNRVFQRQGTIYRANVVIDRNAKNDPDIKRFFESITFDVDSKPADAAAPSNHSPE